MNTPDLRRDARYDVQLICRVSSPFETFGDLSGVTLNMSRSGMLVSFDEVQPLQLMPVVGQPARITLELPRSPSPQRRCIECVGRVVRLGEGAESRCVAFELRRYEFRERPY
jgi:hypothetical protein